MDLTLLPAAKTFLAAEGYDPVYGARPLKRTIQKRLLDPLATKLLHGEIRDGDHLVADLEGGQLVIKKAVPTLAA
jgi:ATP-dependent Clp protease ATP-binding subunit ClpB